MQAIIDRGKKDELSQRRNEASVDNEKRPPLGGIRIYSGPDIFKSGLFGNILEFYVGLYSGKPWYEQINEDIARNRLETQLMNPRSVVVFSTEGDKVTSLATAQILDGRSAINRVAYSVAHYTGNDSTMHDLRNEMSYNFYNDFGFDPANLIQLVILEEFGVKEGFRSLGNIQILARNFLNAVAEMAGSHEVPFLMWTKNSGPMRDIAFSLDFPEIGAIYNTRSNGIGVFAGTVSKFESVAKGRATMLKVMLTTALNRARQGDFSHLDHFAKKIFGVRRKTTQSGKSVES